MSSLDSNWSAVDDWWETTELGSSESLAKLQTLFDGLNEQWRKSPSCFDQDPLSSDWPDDGPLRTSQEENWSKWLAHLCHTAPANFVSDIFDVAVTDSPDRVSCEVPLSSDTIHDRRADVLIQYPEAGMSVEVKIDDNHYSKTPETARLIEQHDQRRTWNHYLLLPATNHETLRANTESQLDEETGDHAILRGTQPNEPDVTILYWRDISQSLRRTLLTDPSATTHWQASAYSFIAVIETVLCQFLPARLITHTLSGTTGFADQIRLRNTPLTDQYAYLTTTHNND
ncbi:hypothetical protein [Haloprofundus halophilus]|uniref:hypothetical protein n=1 Tax=Haloprofundus halophilus TaxID=2283527 RepID=UPI0013006D88|nr:hypothetical protein [Haloprofundus halophilus]